jgi:hypothetical protein
MMLCLSPSKPSWTIGSEKPELPRLWCHSGLCADILVYVQADFWLFGSEEV